MNHLILIGNGFDRAHNLKTDYHSFILWMLKELVNIGNKNPTKLMSLDNNPIINESEDKSFQLTIRQRGTINDGRIEKILDYEGVEDFLKDDNIKFNRPHRVGEVGIISIGGDYQNSRRSMIDSGSPIKISINSQIIEETLTDISEKHWVDIETIYFDLLIKAIEEDYDTTNRVIRLNNDLELLKEKLVEYLIQIESKFSLEDFIKLKPQKFELLKKFLFKDRMRKPSIADSRYSETLIVNFNYTKIVDKYIKIENPQNTKILNIHGSLGDNLDDIIFGYAYRQSDEYRKIKSSKIKEARQNLKNDLYKRPGSTQSQLLNFIDKNIPFTVKIIGHSCGPSDGSLLGRIFESDNCYHINIYHLGWEDFQIKQSNILELSENDEPVMERILKMHESRSFNFQPHE